MSAHAGKQYEIRSKNDTYVIGICESPKSPCMENVGACRTTNGQSASLGVANNNLLLKDKAIGTPFLQYKSGSACVNSNSTMGTRFTTIEFICLTEGMTAEPKVIEEYNCEIIVHFPTKAACQSPVSYRHYRSSVYSLLIEMLFQVQCKAYDYESGREFDVTPLINTNANYRALVSDKLLQETKLASRVPPKDVVSVTWACHETISNRFPLAQGEIFAVRCRDRSINHNCCSTWNVSGFSLCLALCPFGAKFNYMKMTRQTDKPPQPMTACIRIFNWFDVTEAKCERWVQCKQCRIGIRWTDSGMHLLRNVYIFAHYLRTCR